ncbi:immunity protein [Listeria monocytogenes]|nr:immunity protein [Listeria monocytogenes]EBF5168757.1 immunity protein [Listeria monocytogenes]EBF5198436.1 immunity protein [Listeria monocytogenes]
MFSITMKERLVVHLRKQTNEWMVDMYLNNFDGEIIINSEEELMISLEKRPAFNANNFILTFEKTGFPQLVFFVRDDKCVAYFLEGENSSSFTSKSNSNAGPENLVFYENVNGAEIELFSGSIISIQVMLDAAKQFFSTQIKPSCISWMEI